MKPFGKIKGDEAPDGPARVVKPGDWGAVPDGAMKGFSLEYFSMPGRVQPKPESGEQKLNDLEKKIIKLEATHKSIMEKTISAGDAKAFTAMAQGKAAGIEEGEKRASESYQKSLEDLQLKTHGMLQIIEKEKATVFLEFEGQVLELVSNCIHRVFEGLAAEHSEAVLPLLKKAIASIGEAIIVTIKVHPEDFQTVEGNKSYWLPINASLKDVRVVVDERISKGSCFVESDSTSVSGNAAEMAERIDEELKKVFLGKLASLQNIPMADSLPEIKIPSEESLALVDDPVGNATDEAGDKATDGVGDRVGDRVGP